MVTANVIRPARSRRLWLAVALLLALVAVALIAAHTLLAAGDPVHAPLLHHVRQIVCGAAGQPC
jgi:hypothetical protein